MINIAKSIFQWWKRIIFKDLLPEELENSIVKKKLSERYPEAEIQAIRGGKDIGDNWLLVRIWAKLPAHLNETESDYWEKIGNEATMYICKITGREEGNIIVEIQEMPSFLSKSQLGEILHD